MLHCDAYVIEDARYTNNDDDSLYSSRFTMGAVVRGVIENKIHFYLDFRNTLVKGDDKLEKNYNPSLGLPVTVSGKNLYNSLSTFSMN